MPSKLINVTVQWRQHAKPDWAAQTSLFYYHPLQEAWEKFVRSREGWNWRGGEAKLYNRFGQLLPLDYHICPEELTVYLDQPGTETPWTEQLREIERMSE